MPRPRPEFGDVRSVLQHGASRESWEALCALMERCASSLPEPSWREILIYVNSSLERWPVMLCEAPERWTTALLAGEDPAQMGIVRRLDTRWRDVGDDQIFALTRATSLGALRELAMGYPRRVAWRPERLDHGCVRDLATCEGLAGLRHATLTGQHLMADSFASLLIGARFTLHTLDFSHNDLAFLKPSDLFGFSSNELNHLIVRDTDLSSQGVEALHHSGVLTRLRSLTIGHQEQLPWYALSEALARGGAGGRLTHLSLARAPIPGELFHELCDTFDLPELTSLDVSASLPQSLNARQLAHGLHLLDASLESLVLDENALSGSAEGARSLFQDLPLNHLKRLSFKGMRLEDELLSWVDALHITPSMQIDASGNALSLDALQRWLTARQGRGGLTPLQLSLHEVFDEQELAALPELTALATSCQVTLDATRPRAAMALVDPEGEQVWEDDAWE